MLKIVGAKGYIKDVDKFLDEINSYSKKHKLVIQVFNADLIYGEKHLVSSVEHATRAIINKTNTTKTLEMEILLYASGERQLKLAIPKIGVKKGNANIAFVFVNPIDKPGNKIPNNIVYELINKLSFKQDDKVLQGNENTLKKFGINKNEIKTVTKTKYGDLILEKVAMVDIIK